MGKSIQDYLNLVTSEHADKPKFMAMISGVVAPLVQIQSLMDGMRIALFDLDTPPVGDQLDIIGQWVGVSRYVNVPLTGIFFSWDSDAALGWDMGIWQSASNAGGITILPDAQYLLLIKARIAANSWDGTTEGAYAIFGLLFPDLTFLIQDNENMTMAIAVIGPMDSLTQALLTGGYLPLKPEGVHINEYIVTPTGPLFAWDVQSSSLDGWDTGVWGSEFLPS